MKTEAERLRDLEIADVRRIMNKRDGRRFMWRLLGMAGVFEVPDPGSAEVVNFVNGRRLMGTTLMREVFEACPEQFSQMQQEARQDKEVSDQIRARELEHE